MSVISRFEDDEDDLDGESERTAGYDTSVFMMIGKVASRWHG